MLLYFVNEHRNFVILLQMYLIYMVITTNGTKAELDSYGSQLTKEEYKKVPCSNKRSVPFIFICDN